MCAHSNKGCRIPPINFKKINKNEDNVDLDHLATPNSNDEFRSPRRTSKIYDSPTKNFFTILNQYSIIDNTNTKDQDMFTFNDDTFSITRYNSKRPITLKIPKLFIFCSEISKIISNEFTATSKYDRIKVNLETVYDFRALTKYLDEKYMNITPFKPITYRLKIPKNLA